MGDALDGLADLWRWFGQEQCHGYSPLYERICGGVADDREILELVAGAPSPAHMPLTLLAAVHDIVLRGRAPELADIYAGRVGDDPFPSFRRACFEQRQLVDHLLATRQVQTNDCGRSAIIGPGLTWIAGRTPSPLAVIDVGCSAGLNLLCSRYLLDYGDHGSTGPPSSPVRASCRVVAGDPPIAPRLPEFVERVGIDRAPIDLSDADDARWLLACVWPDTGRLERAAAAISLAREDPPRLVQGEANAVLPEVLSELPDAVGAVIVTTWALAYFHPEQRREFERLLAEASRERPVAWLSAEGTGTVECFAALDLPEHDGTQANVLGMVSWERGVRRDELLGFVHQHGNWLDWRAPQANSGTT
jgi:hypothetical protein